MICPFSAPFVYLTKRNPLKTQRFQGILKNVKCGRWEFSPKSSTTETAIFRDFSVVLKIINMKYCKIFAPFLPLYVLVVFY